MKKNKSVIAAALASAAVTLAFVEPVHAAPSLPTLTKGVLTIATDNPAYSPYFVDNKPANGKGF